MTSAGIHRSGNDLRGAQQTLLGILALLSVAPIHADAFTLGELGKLLERNEAGSVRYIEHQYRKALTAPIEQQGELHYTPPDQFEKLVLQPVKQSYALAGETLTITQAGGKRRQVSVRNQPLLRGLLLSFQAVVSGRLNDLQPLYQIDVSGSAAAWRLALKPSDTQLQHYVASIVVTGKMSEPLQFAVTETSGDRVVTEIQPQTQPSAHSSVQAPAQLRGQP